MDKHDDRPHLERDVPSDKPYVEEASVPGDNDPRTAADRALADRNHRAEPHEVTAK